MARERANAIVTWSDEVIPNTTERVKNVTNFFDRMRKKGVIDIDPFEDKEYAARYRAMHKLVFGKK